MNIIKKSGCTVLLALGLLGSSAITHAALVNYELTGTVDSWADSGNVFGLSLNDAISVSGTFDDSVLTGGTGIVNFGSGSGNTMVMIVGSQTFSAGDDTNFLYGYPQLSLNAGLFDGLNIEITFGTSSAFYSQDLWFDGYDDINDNFGNLVSGTWTDFQMTPVPVPAALWLFGSGLLGLVGLARRKK